MDNKDISEFKKILQNAVDTTNQKRSIEERHVSTLGQDIAKMLTPFLKDLASSAKMNKADMREAMQELAANTSAREMPGVDTGAIIEAIYTAFGNLNMPQPRVNVTTPAVNVPPIRWPDGEMSVKGWVNLMGVNLENPLPVQLRDAKGRPVNLDVGAIPMMGGGGGKGDYFTIKGFSASAYAEYLNADNRLRVSVETGGGGLTDTELRASSVPVAQVSGAMWSTAVIDIFGSTAAASVFNADNRIRVSNETGGTGLTDAELRASAVPVIQVSGATESVNVITTVGLTDTQLRASSVPTFQVSGAIDSVNVVTTVGITDTQLRASSVPVEQVSGSNWSTNIIGTVPVSGPVTDTQIRATSLPVEQVSGSNWSTSVTNTVTVAVSGSVTSTVVTGPTVADAVDDGSAPIQVGGIAQTANPTAVAANDVVKSTHDDLGRQVMRPVQVRDLISTAYVSLSTGTETTLLAAVAGAYLDLVYVMGTNNSDAAVTVDIRAVTAGNVQTSIRIPANGTAGVALPVPIPQDETGNAWTADLPDITGTTVTLSALFSKEV